jgi:predicted acylesterase/phospholipase RssA
MHNREIWAAPEALLTTALRAALSVPGVFPPVRLTKREEIESWIGCENVTHLDLVDGAQVSQNPLSALFGWLNDHPNVAEKLSGKEPKDCKVHLVYSLPIGHHPGERPTQAERMNVVEVARVSRELAKRRDTRQDARQTNFMSKLELYIRKAGGSTEVFPILLTK